MPADAQGIESRLARLARAGGIAGRVADEAVSTWRKVDAALSPVIGRRGVAALFKRSLSVIRPEHSFLAALEEGAGQPGDFAALRIALAQQSEPIAAAAHGALLRKFVELLSSLIGESLTERLLSSVWDHSSGDDVAQDNSP